MSERRVSAIKIAQAGQPAFCVCLSQTDTKRDWRHSLLKSLLVASQLVEKSCFWVAQRFTDAINLLF
jgi:hypothetical protein